MRYSLTNPLAYAQSNLVVVFENILEGCWHAQVDHPVSLYAVTKKSNELMAHTYSQTIRSAHHRAALLHGLRSLRAARHGHSPVYPGYSRRPPHRRL